MNTRFIRISLKKRIFISYCLIGLFFFLGENCYASKRPVFRETVRKASADNSTVRGRVVDVSGEPLIGATIREKGGTRGTVTDIEEISSYLCRIVRSCKFLLWGTRA